MKKLVYTICMIAVIFASVSIEGMPKRELRSKKRVKFNKKVAKYFFEGGRIEAKSKKQHWRYIVKEIKRTEKKLEKRGE